MELGVSVFFCPRCGKSGVQADGYAYCTRCLNQRQKEYRNPAKVEFNQSVVIRCPQCTHEREKHPDYKLCVVCGADREARRENKGCKGQKSREEQSWMKGFNALSQEFLLRKLK